MRHVSAFILLALLCFTGAALAGTFTQPSAARVYERGDTVLRPDGALAVRINIRNGEGGRIIDGFEVIVPASGAVVDSEGNQIAAGVPVAISSARLSLTTALDAAIDNAAAAGKFHRR